MDQILYILPRAFAIGVLISAPMGPIGMLIIQRTLAKGRWPAFFTGIGAALSDLAYCLLTGLGISFITDFIDANQLLLRIIGSVVLAAFGVFLFRKNPTRALQKADVQTSNTFFSDTVSGFFLTFSNPLILFFIIGLFARFDFVMPEFNIYHYIFAYAMIFGGAVAWWYAITLLVNRLRKRFNVRSMWMINRIIGSILIGMALFGIIVSVYDYLPVGK